MSGSEDLVIVDSSDYAQVVFDEVKDCFSNNKNLECVFTLNDLSKAEESDWIGIYKVGFSNCSEHCCLQTIKLSDIHNGKGKVIFTAEILPCEDGEFYQFVYVSESKQIRGASLPFQFKHDESQNFIEEDEQDAVVIKFELNDTISEIKTRCSQLSVANEKYERLIKENEDLIKSLKEEVAAIKLRCFRLTMDNEKLNFTLRNKADGIKNLADKLTVISNENTKLQEKSNDLSEENKSLLDSLQDRINQVAQLKNELESVRINKEEIESVLNFKESELMQLQKDKDELNRIADDLHHINGQIVTLEKQVDERVCELNEIRNDLKNNQEIVQEQTQTINTILCERDSLNELNLKLTKEKNELEMLRDNLEQELNMSNDKLLAAENCKEMLASQLNELTEELIQSKKNNEIHLSQIEELKTKLSQVELEKAAEIEKYNEFKLESARKYDQLNGSNFALRLAINHLEPKLKAIESKKDDQDENRKRIEALETEREELRERVREGAKEYAKLFEKYRLAKNQMFNNDMHVYHDLSSDDVILRRRNIHEQSNDITTDSAIQNKTMSQSARASTADIENTLLDALLGASFYNKTCNTASRVLEIQQEKSVNHLNLATTTQQPKSQSQASNLSDDGLKNIPIQEFNRLSTHHDIQETQLNCQQQPVKQSNLMTTSVNEFSVDNSNPMCEICDYIFPSGVNTEEIDKHYTIHYGPSCPVCFLQFHKGYAQTEFENHVNSHFSN